MNKIIRYMKKEERKYTATLALYKNDMLFKVLLDIVCKKTGNSTVINVEVRQLIGKELQRDNTDPYKVAINVALEFYGYLKPNNLDEKFNGTGDFINFVRKCLTNKLKNGHKKEEMIDGLVVGEECHVALYMPDFDNGKFNSRPNEKVTVNKFHICDLSYDDDVSMVEIIDSKVMVSLFKEFYGDELIDSLLLNRTTKDAIFDIDEAANYHMTLKKLRRSRSKFIEFLATKNLTMEDLI